MYLIFRYEGIEECCGYKTLRFHEKVSYLLLAFRKIDKQLGYQRYSVYGRKRLPFLNILVASRDFVTFNSVYALQNDDIDFTTV